ncbi:MAG: alcohol dehydrogenase catalytic domain-containing protein [Acidobacteriota bacterium]
MLALWLENQELKLRNDLPRPTARTGEALVRVLRAGICNTDLEMVRGFYPFAGIPGHEFVGRVEDGPEELQGRRVVGEINIVCGECPACSRGHKSHCRNRRALGIKGHDGAFAEYLCLPVENLHTVPDTVSTDAATFVEPLAAALEIQQQISIESKHRICVVGPGKLGTLIIYTLALTGAEITVVGRSLTGVDRFEPLGLEMSKPDQVEAGCFDISVECTGNADGFEVARRALRPRGTLVLKSTYSGELTFDASSLVVDEITLVGSRCGPFEPAIELLASGMIEVDSLISEKYPLDRGLEAFDRAARPGALKVLIEPV